MADDEPAQQQQQQQQQQPALTQVVKPLSLIIPVTIKEAALDSPTFRSTAVHFSEQVELIERWLDNYVRSASKLALEASTLDNLVTSFLGNAAVPPAEVSEAILDHDYTLLALRRYGDGAREWWNQTLRGMKKLESAVCQPVRHFLQTDLRSLKEARRNLEISQRAFDALIARYAGLSKMKDPIGLREEAFQLHEARKHYLKASMDFCVLAPIVRAALDQLLVKIMADQWREMKSSRELAGGPMAKWGGEMDRVRGWSKELESSERLFKRELHTARKKIEESAETAARPSRELDDYGLSTVPFLGTAPPATTKANPVEKSEKQGWLFQRTMHGKPAKALWVRRWFYVKNGIFGWLMQGLRSGAVEESEKVGVLLCGVRPAFQEERRFCFQVKTKDSTIMLQAETQRELAEWILAFELVKRKALEDPASTERPASPGMPVRDPAFAITPPIAPELAVKAGEGHINQADPEPGIERIGSPPMHDQGPTARGASDATRRPPGGDSDSSRDQYQRIISKLDLHRKVTTGSSGTGGPGAGVGGIASLISASHAVMPVGPNPTLYPGGSDVKLLPTPMKLPTSTLAPSTLAYPPAPTNLSKTAVLVSGERGLAVGRDGGMPGGLLSNVWGTTNWGFASERERGGLPSNGKTKQSKPASLALGPEFPRSKSPTEMLPSDDVGSQSSPAPPLRQPSASFPIDATPGHARSLTVIVEQPKPPGAATSMLRYPKCYPLQLKAQDAQFRLLFPHVPRDEILVLVFRATWNPNDHQEFPGRVYVTQNSLYFYSHHLGLVLISSASLASISEVTAAPGRDCDFTFLHFKDGARNDGVTRITIKTFLEPLKLLQCRLNYLVRNANAEADADADAGPLEDVVKALIKMEGESSSGVHSPSVASWDDTDMATPSDGNPNANPRRGRAPDCKPAIRIDGTLYPDASGAHRISRNATKFKLPSSPVLYMPPGMSAPEIEREFNVSAKSLFHVLCGDRSAVFQMLYCGLGAETVVQNPWTRPSDEAHYRREFHYQIGGGGGGPAGAKTITDHQLIDVYNDHLCYVITDRKTPWHLPSARRFFLLSKIAITHVGKARCKLAVFVWVEWLARPLVGRSLVETRARADLSLLARGLAELLDDQAAKVRGPAPGGANSTRKALAVFGHVGVVTTATRVSARDLPAPVRGLVRAQSLRLRRASLASLGFAVGKVALGEVVSGALGLLAAALSAAVRLVSAHGLLVAVLALSALCNVFFAQRDGWSWWRERNAVRYMGRLGVGGAGMVMGRAVWLRDVEHYVGNMTVGGPAGWLADAADGSALRPLGAAPIPPAENRCAVSFKAALRSAALAPAQSALPARLHRARAALAAHRHDLIVALRVVNRVEREVVAAEFEAWAEREARVCRRASEMLDAREREAVAAARGGLVEEVRMVRERWAEYCGDCFDVARRGGGAGL